MACNQDSTITNAYTRRSARPIVILPKCAQSTRASLGGRRAQTKERFGGWRRPH
jgi:hypothetical protein